jgi:uncharacterized protein YhhL (DUF1145 family)
LVAVVAVLEVALDKLVVLVVVAVTLLNLVVPVQLDKVLQVAQAQV